MIANLIKPLPGPSATWPKAARPPEPCLACDENGEQVQEGGTVQECKVCNGSRRKPLDVFYLDPTHSYGVRGIGYAPMCGAVGGRLVISKQKASASQKTGKTLDDIEAGRERKIERTGYDLFEREDSGGGMRKFYLCKLVHPGETAEMYNVALGPKGVTCDCKGRESFANAKANQRAYENGDEVFPSYGCCHLDALAALLLGGWLDLD